MLCMWPRASGCRVRAPCTLASCALASAQQASPAGDRGGRGVTQRSHLWWVAAPAKGPRSSRCGLFSTTLAPYQFCHLLPSLFSQPNDGNRSVVSMPPILQHPRAPLHPNAFVNTPQTVLIGVCPLCSLLRP